MKFLCMLNFGTFIMLCVAEIIYGMPKMICFDCIFAMCSIVPVYAVIHGVEESYGEKIITREDFPGTWVAYIVSNHAWLGYVFYRLYLFANGG